MGSHESQESFASRGVTAAPAGVLPRADSKKAAHDIKELKPEICVIGADAGGRAVAAAAAALSVPTVLIDDGTTDGALGADSVSAGSVASIALTTVAARVNALRHSAGFGIRTVRFGVDFPAVSGSVRDAVAAVAPNTSREHIIGLGVRVVTGAAHFTDGETVMVGGTAIKARRFVIATGASPAVPPIPGLAEMPYLTGKTAYALPDCPRHLIVIGAGATGLELAQAFRRLGAEVTVLESATPLAGEDPECSAVVLDALAREGVKLRTGVEVKRVRRVLARVQVELAAADGTETIEGSHLLLAAGRQANVAHLDLDNAGIHCGLRGIIVDESLRTTNKRVYALGGVIGGHGFDHAAEYQAGLIIRHAVQATPIPAGPDAVPAVIYTDPELAKVGLLEDEARSRAKDIRVLRWPYHENDRAQATGATSGHIKVITDAKGQILGAAIVGALAAESIVPWALAISQKLNISALAGLVVPYPTFAEVGKRAAMTYFMRDLTRTRARRIISWLRREG
jgi:pyruvate/2-oxoglutarate dehydrogenase complex dihydrolipoamide dehydrogenase (E3) component